MLGLVFGATTLAVSTVLAAFMGGLALGSALAGKLAQTDQEATEYVRVDGDSASLLYALLVPFCFAGSITCTR